MVVQIIAVFIPIVMLVGLFAAIALNIYYKYETNIKMSERVPIETLGQWYRTNAEARLKRNRATGLCVGGLLVGLGLGIAIGCVLLAANAIPHNTGFERDAIATFLVISLAILFGGAGMVGAYFLERKLDKVSRTDN
jgi:Kef-type K+ transport system membrane component KefB